MRAIPRSEIRATLTMIGTIIGAGVFGMPYVMKTLGGVAGTILFWLLASVVITTHALYADLILRKPELRQMRLPGHVRRILGDWPSFFALISHPFSIIGACLAYIILGGGFIASLMGTFGFPADPFFWQIFFWVVGAAVVFFGWKVVSRIQGYMVWALIALLLFSVAVFLPSMHVSALVQAHWENAFLPFGVMLFAASGFIGIPDVVEVSGYDRTRAMRAVVIGSGGAALLIWLFGLFAYLAVPALTKDPADVARVFPLWLSWLLPLIGFFSVSSAFITQTEDLKTMFHYDLRLPSVLAWGITLGVPLLLFYFVQRDFLSTIGFVGSFFGVANALFILSMSLALAWRSKKVAAWRIVVPIVCVIIFSFALIWRILTIV